MAERLERVRKARAAQKDLPGRLRGFAERVAGDYETRPVTKREWNQANAEKE